MPINVSIRRCLRTSGDETVFNELIAKGGGPLTHRKFYGQVSYADLIASCPLTIYAYDNDVPKAFLALGENSASKHDTRLLVEWAREYYQVGTHLLNDKNLGANLFVRALIVVDERYEKDIMEALLHVAFDLLPEVDSLLLHIPKSIDSLPQAAIHHFQELSRGSETEDLKLHDTFISYKLLVCPRQALLPRLQVRKACIEDHDDLIPVFAQKDSLTPSKGDSIIEGQDSRNKVVVGVARSKAVGLMAVTSQVDLELTQKCFDLEAFDNFTKVDPYTGSSSTEPNVVALKVFCLDKEFASRACDLLSMAFDLFPEQQYLLLSLPTGFQVSSSLFAPFTPIHSKPTSAVTHALYALHKETLLATDYLHLRRYNPSQDQASIQELLSELIVEPSDTTAVASYLKAASNFEKVALKDNPSECAFVVTVAGQVAGILFCAAAKEAELDHLHTHYNTEAVVPYPSRFNARDISILRSYIANPLILAHTSTILKEVLRQTLKKAFFHETPLDQDIPAEIHRVMLPIRPRRVSHSPSSTQQPSYRKLVHAVTVPRLHELRQVVHKRIVIVGAGTTAVTLLEELLFDHNFAFTNLTLVSPNGLQSQEQSPMAGFVGRDADLPTKEQFAALGLKNGIRVITAPMVSLDREKKVIVLPHCKLLGYDALVLTTGRQDKLTSSFAAIDYETGAYILPKGVFSLTRPHLAKAFVSSLQVAANNAEQVLVYGSGPQILASLEGILRQGIRPINVNFVTSMHEGTGTMLCDTIIDEVILSHLAVLDVHITWGAKLTSLITTDENLLRGVRVQKEGRELELVASVLVIDEGKDVDPIVFAAINANGLVYDGRLVVDETFRTTDPDIFAAGPLTKFSRKVCGGTYLDQHSSREIGQHLARSILQGVGGGSATAYPKHGVLGMRMVQPRAETLSLPGGLCYFHAHSLATPQEHQSVVSTGSPSAHVLAKGMPFFSVAFDSLGRIHGLTYLGKEQLDAAVFLPLIGLQDAYLKGKVDRLESQKVDDWVSYLRQGWTAALFHDNFASFTKELQGLLTDDAGAKEIVQNLLDIAAEGKDNETIQRVRTHISGPCGSLLPAELRKTIETETVGFLKHNSPSLPNYRL